MGIQCKHHDVSSDVIDEIPMPPGQPAAIVTKPAQPAATVIKPAQPATKG
jgi:hypothetical protein